MSVEGVGVSILWKPIGFLLSIIGALLLFMWNALQKRIQGVEDKSDSTENTLAKDYYSKQETNNMIELHIKPLVQALEKQTKQIDKLCDKLDNISKD